MMNFKNLIIFAASVFAIGTLAGIRQANAFEAGYVIKSGRDATIDQGFASGLQVGDLLLVQREGKKVGLVRVQQLSEKSCKAEIISTEGDLLIEEGDLVAYSLLPYVSESKAPETSAAAGAGGGAQDMGVVLLPSGQRGKTDAEFLSEIEKQIAAAEGRLGVPLDLPQDLYPSDAGAAISAEALPPDPLLDMPASPAPAQRVKRDEVSSRQADQEVEMQEQGTDFEIEMDDLPALPQTDWSVNGTVDPAAVSAAAANAAAQPEAPAQIESGAVAPAAPKKQSSDGQIALENLDSGGLQAYIKNQKLALNANPKNRDAMINLGFAHFQNGDYLHAVEWFKAAVEAKPKDRDNDRLIFQIVKAYYLGGDKNSAAAYLNYLKENFPNSSYVKSMKDVAPEGQPSLESKPSDDDRYKKRKPKKMGALPDGGSRLESSQRAATTALFYYEGVAAAIPAEKIDYRAFFQVERESKNAEPIPIQVKRAGPRKMPQSKGPKLLPLEEEEAPQVEKKEKKAGATKKEKQLEKDLKAAQKDIAKLEKRLDDLAETQEKAEEARKSSAASKTEIGGRVVFNWLNLRNEDFLLPRHGGLMSKRNLSFIGNDSNLTFSSELGQKTAAFVELGFTDEAGDVQALQAWASYRPDRDKELRVGRFALPFGRDERLIQIEIPRMAFYSDFYKARGDGVYWRDAIGENSVLEAAAAGSRMYDYMADSRTDVAFDYFPLSEAAEGVDYAVRIRFNRPTNGGEEGKEAQFGLSATKRNLDAQGMTVQGSLKAFAFDFDAPMGKGRLNGQLTLLNAGDDEAIGQLTAWSNLGFSQEHRLIKIGYDLPINVRTTALADIRRLKTEGGFKLDQYNIGFRRQQTPAFGYRVDWKGLKLPKYKRDDNFEATAIVEF